MKTSERQAAEIPSADLGEHILGLEKSLLTREVRRSPEQLDRLLADDFREFGSSGRVYDKAAIIQALQTESALLFSIEAFQAKALGPDLVLATYHAVITDQSRGEMRTSLRSSLWR